ncbi:MAG TPA: TrmH family RNA methyltransferase [Acidimicrobiales bacterium]|nr:TrmH family RNA methyltransferase [Acidimicrobiales bacterium]
MRQFDGTGLKRLHRTWRRHTGGRLGLVLDDVEGPFNVGAIIRTAAALRVDDVWLAGRTPGPQEAKVGKTALGTDRYLTFHQAEGGAAAVLAAQGAGYRVVAIELADGAVPLHELDLGDATCLVVGHEDRGLSPAVLDACDAVAFLPQLGRVGSLNVATAASIACYEVRRRAWANRGDDEADEP